MSDGFELVVGDDVIHKAGSEMEARAVLPYVQSQLAAGVTPKNVGRMLRGESVKSAEGGSGESDAAQDGAASKKKAPAKKSPAKAAEKKPAKAAEKKPAKAGGADTSILKGSVAKVKAALESGDHDAHLAELLEAEKSGKGRKGAIEAIEGRMA